MKRRKPAHMNTVSLRLRADSGHLFAMLFIALYTQSNGHFRTNVDLKLIFVILGFDSRRGLGIFFFITAARTALGPTQPPIQWVLGVLSLEVKQPGREADHSPPSSAEVKECV